MYVQIKNIEILSLLQVFLSSNFRTNLYLQVRDPFGVKGILIIFFSLLRLFFTHYFVFSIANIFYM